MTAVVSIVTPYLDSAAFLGQAIASAEEQTFTDWELLLVDDGSRDSSRAIADSAASRDPRIRSLARPADRPAGAASARNWGLRQATGDYLVFLDSDDRFLPEKLVTEIELMRRFPDAGITCGASIWWHPGHEYRNWSDSIRSLHQGLYRPPSLLNHAILLQRDHVPSLCSVMVRRPALPALPAFEPGLRLYEDQAFLAKIFLAHPAYIGRHCTSLYRQHPASTSSNAERKRQYRRLGRHQARAHFLAWIRDYLEQGGFSDASIEEALLCAEALQTGDYSKLEIGRRAKLLGWRAGEAVARVPRRTARWFNRRLLQLTGTGRRG